MKHVSIGVKFVIKKGINMKVNKTILADGKIEYSIKEHKSEIFRAKISKDNLKNQIKIVKDFMQTEHAKFKNYTEKEVLLAFSKIAIEIAECYKKKFPKGGYRKNSGRKKGSLSNGIKSARTARFTRAITEEEKIFLENQLEKFRAKNDFSQNVQN